MKEERLGSDMQCPQCGMLWEDTQCLACHGWSRHADWYHELTPTEEAAITTVAE
jgi:hypothetical protein